MPNYKTMIELDFQRTGLILGYKNGFATLTNEFGNVKHRMRIIPELADPNRLPAGMTPAWQSTFHGFEAALKVGSSYGVWFGLLNSFGEVV